MSGYLVLEGGSEFSGKMSAPDLRSLELAGGMDASVAIIPTAAAPDRNHHRAGENGKRWFEQLGARNVCVLHLIDGESANDPSIVQELKEARLIFLLGGFPRYLGQTLMDTDAWQAMLHAYRSGAVISGSSAGAMVLCEFYYSPREDEIVPGLNLVPGICIMPHYNAGGKRWVQRLRTLLPDVALIGIDEQTAMIDDGKGGTWSVFGAGQVTVYRSGAAVHSTASEYEANATFSLVK